MSNRRGKRAGHLESASLQSTLAGVPQPDQARIAEVAYQRWVDRGCPQGTADEDRFAAERELKPLDSPVRRRD